MAFLLHIESSSTVCSVALSNNELLIAQKEINNGYSHAENLHLFIQTILVETNVTPQQLSAISISSGPGSYTGLRIGYSTAKGLCYALNIPLVEVSTLQALSSLAKQKCALNITPNLLCPLIDARRMEVYTALFDANLNSVKSAQALILTPETIQQFNNNTTICFFGNGMPKAKELLQILPTALFVDEILPSATSLITLAYQKYLLKEFVDIAYAEPNYLKEFYFATSQK